MWHSWRSLISHHRRTTNAASAGADSACSASSTAGMGASGPVNVFGDDALTDVTAKYSLGKVVGKGARECGENKCAHCAAKRLTETAAH